MSNKLIPYHTILLHPLPVLCGIFKELCAIMFHKQNKTINKLNLRINNNIVNETD